MKVVAIFMLSLVAVAASGQTAANQKDRFDVVTTSEGLFLLDRQTGCLWRRYVDGGYAYWSIELRVDDSIGECTISGKKWMDMMNALAKRESK